ncbi:MAG: hypothetical protein H0U00_15705 [Actinobacteria bacterium]|nr:hypothetical protein [Actinomycetota bacterium]
MIERDRRAAASGARQLDVASFLEWPHGIARLGVVLCTAVALLTAFAYFVKAIDRLGDTARTNAAQNFDDREFAGGNAVVVANRPLYEARALIPEVETYRVVTGPEVEGATELTASFIDHYARYFLMPRRPAPDARWIICYGCDRSALGGGFEVLFEDDAGILVGRLAS